MSKVRRQKTPTGRKSPVLFAKVKGAEATSYPYVAVIRGRVTGEDPFHARRSILAQLLALGEQGKISGAETVRVSYERARNATPGPGEG